MTLSWFRVDSNIASHDKILALIHDPDAPPARRWQATFAYLCAIGYAAHNGTDGRIAEHAFPFIHANRPIADLLVHHALWEPTLTGWTIHNYAIRQELTWVTETKRSEAKRGACIRWHGPDCWGPKGCSRPEKPA